MIYFKYFTSSTFVGLVVFTIGVYLVFIDIKKSRVEVEKAWDDARKDLGRLFVGPLTIKLLGTAIIKTVKVGYLTAKPTVITCVGCVIAGGAFSAVIKNNTYGQINPLANALDILRGLSNRVISSLVILIIWMELLYVQ